MSDHASPVAARRRTDAVFAAAIVIGVGLLAWIVITIQGLSSDLRTANQARDALASQVQRLGATPVAGSPGSRGSVGPAGAIGARGPRGYPGSPGPSGSPGASGSPGKSGASGSPGPAGASGSSGVDGAVGSPGPAGAQGEPGPAGVDGKDGADGQPPEGWTYTDPATGADMDCERAADFDPDHPRYECHATSTPAPSDTPGRGLLGAVAMASAAAYRKLGGGPHA